MQAEHTIISRVEGAAAVAHLRSRTAGVLLAECEEEIGSHLRACGFRHVRRLSDGRGCADFSAALHGQKVLIYVLSVSNMAAPAALTVEQLSYCDSEGAPLVMVVPCVVQQPGAERARCVAMPPVVVGLNGTWGGSAEALQYLPAIYRRGTPSDMPCAAWLIKKHNLIREVANRGVALYPVIAGLAHTRHLPPGVEIKGSGAESPLMLVVLQGRSEGKLQLNYADFYAAEHAVNNLLLVETDSTESGRVKLRADDGAEFSARCAEAVMFPERVVAGLRFLWSLSLLCNHYSRMPDGCDECKPGELCAVVQSAQRCEFCGLPLCHIVARSGGQIVNVYAPVYGGDSPLPSAGERFRAEGTLYAVPDALLRPSVAPEPSPEPSPEPESALQSEAEPDEELLPVSMALAVAAGGLLTAGYKWRAPFKPLFRSGVPDFRMATPQGENLVVLVDTVVGEHSDCRGYARYAPDSYPTHVGVVAPETQPAEVLFLTVNLTADDGGFSVAVEQHGAVKSDLHFCSHVELPAADGLTEQQAARIFGETMVTHDFRELAPLLNENVHYESETAGLSLDSKLDLLRHLRSCYDNWQRRGECANLRFLLSSVEWQGVRRPCTVACQRGEIISATVFELLDGRIGTITSLAGDVLDTLQPIE